MYLTGTTITLGKFEFITLIMVTIKVFRDMKPCLLVNIYSPYQFTWREAPDYLKVFAITVKWATTTSSLGEFAKLVKYYY